MKSSQVDQSGYCNIAHQRNICCSVNRPHVSSGEAGRAECCSRLGLDTGKSEYPGVLSGQRKQWVLSWQPNLDCVWWIRMKKASEHLCSWAFYHTTIRGKLSSIWLICLFPGSRGEESSEEDPPIDITSVQDMLSSHHYKSFKISMIHKLRFTTEVQLGTCCSVPCSKLTFWITDWIWWKGVQQPLESPD